MDEQKKMGEGYLTLKHQLRKTIFDGYKVTIDDEQTINHYYKVQRHLDREICKLMGWDHD